MKLTDEAVAKALGWKREERFQNYGQLISARRSIGKKWSKPNTLGYFDKLPAFTTSLDAIVAEIEARGLGWGVFSWGAAYVGPRNVASNALAKVPGDTAPLVLCSALLAYLKEKKA